MGVGYERWWGGEVGVGIMVCVSGWRHVELGLRLHCDPRVGGVVLCCVTLFCFCNFDPRTIASHGVHY